jgi:hypothetical protein
MSPVQGTNSRYMALPAKYGCSSGCHSKIPISPRMKTESRVSSKGKVKSRIP